ncbi:MAG: S-layer homology domain-containing protein, partial [Chloroflexota bacterium]|nr:S-layer homology domain-containing protein [Chloroflexota bacterium]
NTPTNTPTFTPTNTPTDTPTFTNTPTDTPTLTNTPTDTPTKTPTFTVTNTPTDTPTKVPTTTPTRIPSNTPVPPTQTPGGPSATRTPSNTPVPPTRTPGGPSATPLPTNTPVPPTQTPGGPTATNTPCTVHFSDVTDTTAYYYTPVYYLACHGVISGYSDGTFKPFNNTTRQQMVKIIVLGFQVPIQTPPAGGYTFTDVPVGSTFFSLVETAAVRGIVSGYTCGGANPLTGAPEPCDTAQRPYFRPGNNVTRGQLAKITVLTAGWVLISPPSASFSDVPVGSIFYSAVETAVCHSILSGYSDHTYRPASNATRGQISKIVYNAIGSGPDCGPPATPRTVR